MWRARDGLALPALACALLLACARAAPTDQAQPDEDEPGVCQSIDIRNSALEMQKLNGCRVIEGHLNIVLMERVTYKSFENLSFPDLREITGYLKIYRLKGIRNLGDLFPNLSVVRGMQLFKDFALILFDSENIEMLGLRSLTTIEQGAVRIQNNDRLCYANTVDWGRIVLDGNVDNNIFRANYDARLCGLCPNAQSGSRPQCPRDLNTGRLLCWDDKHCQKVCPSICGESTCMSNGTCCDESCLGGCDGPTNRDCHVCRNFSFTEGGVRRCVDKCPAGMYELMRRCVSEVGCRKMPPPPSASLDPNLPKIKSYKTLSHNNNSQCLWSCPPGYIEKMSRTGGAICLPCPPFGCSRECPGGRIDSLSSADVFRGCTIIRGVLELFIRASGVNTMAVLEAALGEVREIHGGLKVTRSNPLVSLMFLKNLETIIEVPDEKEKSQALHIFNNPNLELLFDWKNHPRLHIEGRLYIHFNPKLCYVAIDPLKQIINRNFTDIEVSEENNGDQASCYQDTLHLQVAHVLKNVVVLTWSKYCVDDTRKLLGYSIYFIIAEQNVTLYGNRDACSDNWNVLDITREQVKSQSNMSSSDDAVMLKNSCDVQPLFYPVTQLTPFTRYAVYVKTYTTLQDRKGAQSPIIYFTTLPGRPSPPQSLSVEALDSHSVFIRWSPPAMPNSTNIRYFVEIQANSYNRDTITQGNSNYCHSPSVLTNLFTVRGEGDEPAEKKEESKYTGEVKNGTCSCNEEPEPSTRFTSVAEQERWESIEFENALQNSVYIKSPMKINRTRLTIPSRSRRSIDNSLSMLVILSGNSRPMLDTNYTNTTDEKNYVSSVYYELGAETRMLTVADLRHFTWYTVNVWACREQHANESKDDYAETWCSERSYNTFRTMKRMDVDVVSNVRAELLPSNKSLPEVNVTWQPPVNPNGFVVAYNVLCSRVEDGQSQEQQNCLTASECRSNQCAYVLRTMLPGNYSIRVTPVTVSGAGNASAAAYVVIQKTDFGYEWVWGVVGGCVIMILVLGGCIWYARRGFISPAEANKLFASVNPEYVSTVYVPDEWEVPRGHIEFLRELGQGSFGMVYEGIAKSIEKEKPETRCAVKTVNEHATDRERIEFLNEASVMKAFDTFHVVRLLGVVSRGQPTLVVMELMEQGDLKTYLRSHRPDAESSLPKKDAGNPPTLQNILQMAIEIADGMAYLSAKKFVHRDLAARNCMVAGDLTVKVGDFGMTRDIYETDYYRKGTKGLLPVRWMSPESLKDGVFSSSSDVWSYGVVLWEMATLAMQPYQGLSNEQVVRYVVEGGVMERPEHCPDRLYELMRACWAHRPAARPTFLQLVANLATVAQPYFRHRSFFHSPLGQEIYALQRNTTDEEQDMPEVNVGAVATGSGSNLFGVSGRLASWVRELSSLRSRTSDDAAAEPLQPAESAPRAIALKGGPNGVLRDASPSPTPASTGC